MRGVCNNCIFGSKNSVQRTIKIYDRRVYEGGFVIIVYSVQRTI